MYDSSTGFLNEAFYADQVSPTQLDRLLEKGWRHFGTYFFRYNFGLYETDVRRVIPLRIRLSDFSLSKSQRRNLRKNSALRVQIGPIQITAEAELLFHRHKLRFTYGIPSTIYDFLSAEPSNIPCRAMQVSVFRGHELVAASYFDVGEISCSGIYGMFEPKLHKSGLGIFTMLEEIEFAGQIGKSFYYQGYSYSGSSFYDYKRRFAGTEQYDWNGKWTSLEALVGKGSLSA